MFPKRGKCTKYSLVNVGMGAAHERAIGFKPLPQKTFMWGGVEHDILGGLSRK